jgi:putative ABC transport system permease protein
VESEIAGKRVRVAGLVGIGTSFGADGNLLASSETYLELLPNTPPGSIEVGLIRLKPGADAAAVVARLRQIICGLLMISGGMLAIKAWL